MDTILNLNRQPIAYGMRLTRRRRWTADEAGAQSSDGTQNTGDAAQPTAIPYARFKEVNEAKKALEARLAELEAAQRKTEQDRLAAEQKWQELAEARAKELDALKPIAARVADIEAALKGTVAARVERLPEDARSLVPEFADPRQTLAWLDANEAKLLRPAAPATDAGARGDKPVAPVKLTEGQKRAARLARMSEEDYAKSLQLLQGNKE